MGSNGFSELHTPQILTSNFLYTSSQVISSFCPSNPTATILTSWILQFTTLQFSRYTFSLFISFSPIFACSLFHLHFWIYYHYHSCEYLYLTRQYSRVLSTPPRGIQTSFSYFHLCSSIVGGNHTGGWVNDQEVWPRPSNVLEILFSLWLLCSLKQLFLTLFLRSSDLSLLLSAVDFVSYFCARNMPIRWNFLIFLWIFKNGK